jgi:hypothetical protein
MTGLLELFALAELGSGIGYMASWRNKVLTRRINYFHPPNNPKSQFDKLVHVKTGPVVTRQDRFCLKLADGLIALIRSLVMFDAFRQLIRALALPNSPLRRKLRSKRRPK